MPDILLHVITAALYAALAVLFWRTRWQQGGAIGIASWERLAILAPLAVHSWLLYDALFAQPVLRFGFALALSTTLWLAVGIYWIESLFYNLQGMYAIVLPVAAVCSLLPGIFPGLETPAYAHRMAFRAHMALAMAAYSLFTIAALHALMMALLEKRLHGRRVREANAGEARDLLAGPLAGLPPLLTMERLMFTILTLGFVCLTLTLVTGAIFSEEIFGKALRFNHKTLFALLSWVIFGLLLAGRWLYGWRGRRALRWTLTGFLVLLLAYVGSRFVLEVVLGRSLA